MFANNTVGFQVDDWEPKIQILPGPNGVNTAFPIRKPPGGTFQYRFTSPNTTVWHEKSDRRVDHVPARSIAAAARARPSHARPCGVDKRRSARDRLA